MFGRSPTPYAIGGATTGHGFGSLAPIGVGHNSGFLATAGPGRTDNIHIAPDGESYIIPADIVSGLGEGNSLNGALALEDTLARMAHASLRGFASLGPPQKSNVEAAGGEYVVSPQQVIAIGFGSLKRGHGILDKFVLHVRATTIKTLQNLRGPIKS